MKKCLTPAIVWAELKRMPETLGQTYDRILQTVPSLHQPFVRSALCWLAFSVRLLNLQELAEAAVIDPKSGRFNAENRLVSEDLILQLCGSLLSVSVKEYAYGADGWLSEKIVREFGWSYLYSGRTQTFSLVSLSHYSVEEYIASERLRNGVLSSYYASGNLANTFLAECCLLYLLEFNGGEIASQVDFSEYPLLCYSGRFWIDHWKQAQGVGEHSVLRALLVRLFDPSNTGGYMN
jgi:hypothetical protein